MINNTITGLAPKIPDILKPILEIVSIFSFNEREALLLLEAIESVEKQFVKDNLQSTKVARITIIVTSYGDVSLSIPKDSYGHYMNQIIVYPIQRWRDEHASDLQILISCIEEMCHCIWYLYDEIDIKYKVLEIARNVKGLENIGISSIYKTETFEH